MSDDGSTHPARVGFLLMQGEACPYKRPSAPLAQLDRAADF